MKLAGARVTVIGLGASGLAAARLLTKQGADVVVNDARGEAELSERAAAARALGVRLDLGGHVAERLARSDLIVVSPGVPPLAALAEVERKGVPIVSEIELASWFVRGDILGVTGTNGKSTVTTLLGEMCKASGRPTFVGGNLGTPLVDVVDSAAAGEGGLVVVELSSFQLERVSRFRAHVGVLLNITDDHLDRYPSFAAYAAAKGRLFMGQRAEDFALVPAGDALCLSLARAAASQLAVFDGPDAEVRREQASIVDSVSGLRIAQERLGIQGEHNIGNACAAALAARLIGIAPAQIEQVLTSFKGLPHRMQWVDTLGAVRFFDDSKATNVGAAVAAVQGLAGQSDGIVLIAGGKDKGGSYAPLRAALAGVGRGLVLIGESAAQIEQAFAGSGLPVVHAASMSGAVEAAWKLAAPSAAVLLAPACASFDMFRSYAHRGEAFCQAVQALRKEQGS